jgi:4'-phosphopantetheinyl transferase
MLTDEERERAGRFRFEIHRRRYVASRAVLRSLLSRYLDVADSEIAIVSNAHGKPELLDPRPGLHFNLSHAGGVAVFAFAIGRPVGVDIEETSREVSFRALATRFFSYDERKVLDTVRDEDVRTTFYECWTRKEAYIKALGLGVTHGLDNFSVAIGAGVRPALLHSDVDTDAPQKWGMRTFTPADGFVGAVVVEGLDCDLRAFEAVL